MDRVGQQPGKTDSALSRVLDAEGRYEYLTCLKRSKQADVRRAIKAACAKEEK
jgi:hypothetical protein